MRKTLMVLLTLTAVLATTQVARAASPYVVTASTSTSTIELGKGSVKISGKVTPAAKGQTVTIQRKYGNGSWKTLSTTRTTSSGSYAKSVKPAKAAVTSYRVLKAKSSSRAAGTSPTVVVKVGRWRYLIDLPLHRAPVVGTTTGTATIHGKAYTKSVIAGQTNTRAYVTDGLCPRITAWVGWEDRSAAGSVGEAFAVRYVRLGPGGPGPAGYSFGDYEPVQNQDAKFFDQTFASDPLPLAFGVGSNTETTDDIIAWGSPRVYCYS